MGYTRYNSLYAHKKYNCPSTTRMRLKCSNCPRNYKHRQQFVRHLRYECGKTPTVSCPYCPIKFYHKFRLKPHTRRVHGIEFEG
ncbi:hypothetical protein HUJ05_008993 [Dendroctonus ponderosae]|nr:hypothetical protein HUJ05_008993 [Dendroctonus ponderosae]